MVRLLQALRPGARLVLLGDRDQLVSVEPGKVFGDLCRAPAGSALSRCVVTLSRSFRFVEGSGIGEASRLVNEGKGEEALAAMEGGRHGDLSFREARNDGATRRALEEALLEAYGPVVTAPSVEEALAAFRRFRILCAVRRGPFGVEEVCRLLEHALERKGLVRPRGGLYRGRPVMVTRNDYRQGLFNGDVGMLHPGPDGGALRAFFPGEEGGPLRDFLPGRLPGHETAWAMTVHKSQGSEFDRVLLLLGDAPSAAHTRELVYTGLTRARGRVDTWSTREVFSRAVANPVRRRSGLWERLGGSATL
jgi:exodeoxyribonuclease V alpha subunit